MSFLIYLEISNVTETAPLPVLVIHLKTAEEQYESCSTGKQLAEVEISRWGCELL